MTDLTLDDLAKRRVPAMIAYLSPFRIVEKDDVTEPWSATIDQINRNNWDYVGLHELIGGVDVGLDAPYHLVVARDGAVALPPLPKLASNQAAVEFFNHCIAAVLLGGIYCEAITHDGLDFGCIIDWQYLRSRKTGAAATNRFHQHIRYQRASPLDSIQLNQPRTLRLKDLDTAMRTGLDALSRLEPMRGEFLLKGVTGLARRDWGVALTNLWIVTEQLLEALWRREIIEPVRSIANSKARRQQLNDHRSWSAATRIEMLHQKSVLDLETLDQLSVARKARNDLVHRGAHPSEIDARSCYAGISSLMKLLLRDDTLPLLNLDISNHVLTDPFAPSDHSERLRPTHYMTIPKLPGEEELEKAEAKLSANSTKSGRDQSTQN